MNLDKGTPEETVSGNTLPLQMVGILSSLIFALNFSLEFLIVTRQPQEHQLLLLGLMICLAVWALIEGSLVHRCKPPGRKNLVVFLAAQLAVELVRAGLLVWPSYHNNASSDVQQNAANLFMFALVYASVFLMIARASLKIHTARLDNAYRTIIRLEASALKLTEAIPVGTFVLEVSLEGWMHFSFLSQRWLAMLGMDREAVAADPSVAYSCIYPEDRRDFISKNAEVIKLRQPLWWEGRVLVDGQTRWMNMEAIPRQLRDRTTAYEGVIIDVTAHKDALAALERTHDNIARAAIAQSRIMEREQLLQDMHDGFGSQLASARLLAERGHLEPHELADILQQCMSDLFLFTDTLRTGESNLADGLYDLRYRTTQRTAHLSLDWQWLIKLDPLPKLDQRSVLYILRIIQEALNNALKHSRATRIIVAASIHAEQDVLELSVTDNGSGLPEHIRYGRGLRGMQHRAREIGAELTLLRAEPGTTVRFIMGICDDTDNNPAATP